jgi:hypothetical protein
MRKAFACFAASAAVVLGSASPALADDLKVRAHWKSCETLAAGLSFRTEFSPPARYYGEGRYLIKSEIRWDKYTSAGSWRVRDSNTIQTPWLQINNPNYEYGLSHGDRTTWGNLYPNHWRAHVTVKLIKNRPGPKDKRVATVERLFNKGTFRERGSYCQGGQFRQ